MADHYVKISEIEKGKKLKYFWDYYKIHTIVIICLIIMAFSILKATVFRAKPDSYILIATKNSDVTTEQIDALTHQLETMDIDFNNDKKNYAYITNIPINTNTTVQQSEQQAAYRIKLSAETATGNDIIQIVSENMIDELIAEGVVAKSSELTKFGFENTDDYVKIPVSETKLSKSLSTGNNLYIVIRPPVGTVVSSDKKTENYINQMKLLKLIR